MMKHLRQLCLGFILVLALSIPAFADVIQNGITGEIGTGITGDMQNGITGTIDCGITGDILSLLLTILY
jgi:hypothetical protein